VLENPRFTDSTPVIRRAVALLLATFDELVEPGHWCQEAWACDRSGQPIGGTIVEAVESEKAVRRCLIGTLIHVGIRRHYRIAIDTAPRRPQAFREIVEAPPSWLLAADVLGRASLYTLCERHPDPFYGEPTFSEEMLARERIGTIVALNELGSYSDVVWAVVFAVETLRAELDRRDDEGAR
jgi:hypothetical protein